MRIRDWSSYVFSSDLLLRLEHQLDTGELARAAGLLLVRVIDFGRARNGLAVGHLGRADIGVDLELALHPVDEDLEVELAHPLDHGLTALMIDRHAEGRILLGEAIERHAHLLLVGLRLRLDRDLDDRVRELHPLQDDLLERIAERIARDRKSELQSLMRNSYAVFCLKKKTTQTEQT